MYNLGKSRFEAKTLLRAKDVAQIALSTFTQRDTFLTKFSASGAAGDFCSFVPIARQLSEIRFRAKPAERQTT